ncbi:hypothetical protein PVAP13_2NG283803 [Panicum virgatum]|uniref:Uncharacterized protein n=1 Tax=Panicum virgatum TaxID=38727 RepID=A0A8T0VI63_PANVG|nr:hypothetical protein PVAP13_2NG283803 [Panicum virgatum]
MFYIICALYWSRLFLRQLYNPGKRLNPPLTTKGTRKMQTLILMATGAKAHFIAKRTWWSPWKTR